MTVIVQVATRKSRRIRRTVLGILIRLLWRKIAYASWSAELRLATYDPSLNPYSSELPCLHYKEVHYWQLLMEHLTDIWICTSFGFPMTSPFTHSE